MNHILETHGLVKHFDGVHAVDHLSIAFQKGTITSVSGPNGSGKSTLMNTLTGVLPIDGGVVVIDKTTKLSRIQPYEIATYGITRTFQEVRLFEQMTVEDNILVVLTERNVFGAFFEKHGAFHVEKAHEVLKQVNLYEKRHELAVNLSYGQRRLLEIARTVAMNSQVFLYDESFAGLFPEMIKIVVDIMKSLREQGKTVILIEHNMNLIRELSDYVFVLDSGKLLAEGKPEEVLSRKDVIEAYLGE